MAIPLGVAVYYVPFAISAARTGSAKGLEMVYRENVVRFFHPFDHRGPIYLYCYVIFALMMPWSAFLPAALAEAHRNPPAVTPARTTRPSLRAGLFLGDLHFFHALRIAAQLLPVADPSRRGAAGRKNAGYVNRSVITDEPPAARPGLRGRRDWGCWWGNSNDSTVMDLERTDGDAACGSRPPHLCDLLGGLAVRGDSIR